MTERAYRKSVREAWLPLTGRKKLTGRETRLIARWFGEDIPVRLVLRAIERVSLRSRQRGFPLYSLGIVVGDVEQLRRTAALQSVDEHDGNAWRERWASDLDALAAEAEEPLRSGLLALKADLPRLSITEATGRFTALEAGCFYGSGKESA